MLPQGESVPKNHWRSFGGILMLLFYSFQNFIPGMNLLPFLLRLAMIGGIIAVTLLLFWPELKRDIPLFFEHWRAYSCFFFPRFCFFFVIYYGVSLVIALLVREPAANQDLLMQVSLPILAFTSLLYAPVVEETIYRGFLRRCVENDGIFILLSALIFGAVHMLHSGQSMAQYLYIVDYAFLGAFLAWIYVKSDNICVAMLGHFCLNLLAFLPIAFLGA